LYRVVIVLCFVLSSLGLRRVEPETFNDHRYDDGDADTIILDHEKAFYSQECNIG